jgi:rhamnose utilization protein RhaD (predicted bifunctional aldolase and dehydrogenase)
MSENTKDVLPQILMKIQEDIASFRNSVEKRFDRIEEQLRKQRRDSAGMLVLVRAGAGEFEERMSAVEQRVSNLEGRTGSN